MTITIDLMFLLYFLGYAGIGMAIMMIMINIVDQPTKIFASDIFWFAFFWPFLIGVYVAGRIRGFFKEM